MLLSHRGPAQCRDSADCRWVRVESGSTIVVKLGALLNMVMLSSGSECCYCLERSKSGLFQMQNSPVTQSYNQKARAQRWRLTSCLHDVMACFVRKNLISCMIEEEVIGDLSSHISLSKEGASYSEALHRLTTFDEHNATCPRVPA